MFTGEVSGTYEACGPEMSSGLSVDNSLVAYLQEISKDSICPPQSGSAQISTIESVAT